MTADVFFYEAFAEEEAALRAALPHGIRAGYSAATIQASGDAHPPAPLISIRTQSAVPAAWAPALRGVLARTTGYDHLLAWRAALPEGRPTPLLACLPEYCTRAVAEQAALMWMALLRRLPEQADHWHSFDRDNLTGGECLGRTLLVVGVGRIGHEVCRVGAGLGMNVIGCDVVQRHADVAYVAFAEGIARADVVVAAMNLTPANARYFRQETLATARPGLLLVNVARGELVRTEDLPGLLQSGRLGGVALDVYENEPAIADALRGLAPATPEVQVLRELARQPRVILTPHNAFNTHEAVLRKSRLSAEQVSAFHQTGAFRWPLQP